jgi:hypothetical protein
MKWAEAVRDARRSGVSEGRKYAVIGYRSLTGGWDWWAVPSGGITHGQRRTFHAEQRSLRERSRGSYERNGGRFGE